ncbi:MAG: maleylpyruvate isomerase family mycothiol-dependent enzyme [Dietzia sp.]
MTDWIALQSRAADLYDEVLPRVTDWDAATPCSDWTTREVLAHVVDEQLWVPGLLAGGTVEEVADDLEDRLRRLRDATGPELVADWGSMTAPVAAAWRGTCAGDADTEVHLSYGLAPARHYLAQQVFDLAVHAWDIAASQGLDLRWGAELERAVLEFVRADLAVNPAPELFDPAVPGFDGPGVSARDEALALTGRDPSAWPVSPR